MMKDHQAAETPEGVLMPYKKTEIVPETPYKRIAESRNSHFT